LILFLLEVLPCVDSQGLVSSSSPTALPSPLELRLDIPHTVIPRDLNIRIVAIIENENLFDETSDFRYSWQVRRNNSILSGIKLRPKDDSEQDQLENFMDDDGDDTESDHDRKRRRRKRRRSLREDALIYVPARMFASGNYNFSLNVTDSMSGLSTLASTMITIIDLPVIHSLNVWPASGNAYVTVHHIECNASSEFAPLTYEFAASNINQFASIWQLPNFFILTGETLTPTLNFTLPPGEYVIHSRVTDTLGGRSLANGTFNILSMETQMNNSTVSIHPDQATVLNVCVDSKRAITYLRDIAASLSGIDERMVAELPILQLLSIAFQLAHELRRVEEELRDARYALRITNAMPQSSTVTIGQCSLLNVSLNVSGALQSDSMSPMANQSISMLAQSIWKVANQAVMRNILENPGANGTRVEVVGQAIEEIVNYTITASIVNGTELQTYVKIINDTIVTQTPPEFLIDRKLARHAAFTLSNLLKLVDGTLKNGRSSCQAFNSITGLIDRLLDRTAVGLVPSMAVQFVVRTNFLDAASFNRFSDDATANTSDVRVELDPIQGSTEQTSLTINYLPNNNTALRMCRPSPRGFDFASNIVSITSDITSPIRRNITILSSSAGGQQIPTIPKNGPLECRFWDTKISNWSTEGCTTVFSSNGGDPVCSCNHFTAFAIMAETEEQNGEYVGVPQHQEDAFIFFLCCYLCLLTLSLYTCWFVFRRKSDRFDRWKTCFLTAQSATRIPETLLFSGIADGFNFATINQVGLLMLLAIPYSLMWGAYTISLYQWGTIVHNTRLGRLVKDMFAGRSWIPATAYLIIFSSIWVSFGIFVFYKDTQADVIGPAMLFSVTALFSVLSIYLGYGIVDVMSTVKNVSHCRVKDVSMYVTSLGTMLTIQALVLLVSLLATARGESKTKIARVMLAYYTTDVLLEILQIDFINKLGLLKSVAWATVSVYRKFSAHKGIESQCYAASAVGAPVSMAKSHRTRTDEPPSPHSSSTRHPSNARRTHRQATKSIPKSEDANNENGQQRPENDHKLIGGSSSTYLINSPVSKDGKKKEYDKLWVKKSVDSIYENGQQRPENDHKLIDGSSATNVMTSPASNERGEVSETRWNDLNLPGESSARRKPKIQTVSISRSKASSTVKNSVSQAAVELKSEIKAHRKNVSSIPLSMIDAHVEDSVAFMGRVSQTKSKLLHSPLMLRKKRRAGEPWGSSIQYDSTSSGRFSRKFPLFPDRASSVQHININTALSTSGTRIQNEKENVEDGLGK